MKLSYFREAISDLKRLREFIASKNPEAAQKVAKTVQKGIAQLKAFPYLGVAVELAPDPETIRDLILGNYIARYLIHQKHVYTLRVWHHKEPRL